MSLYMHPWGPHTRRAWSTGISPLTPLTSFVVWQLEQEKA